MDGGQPTYPTPTPTPVNGHRSDNPHTRGENKIANSHPSYEGKYREKEIRASIGRLLIVQKEELRKFLATKYVPVLQLCVIGFPPFILNNPRPSFFINQ